jgi:glycosyltransferase involved in cell wall biosynthesis
MLMNIGIFTNNYLPIPYGVTGSVESFRMALEQGGHSIYIFAPRWPGYQDANPNVFRYPSLDISVKSRFPLAIPFSRSASRRLVELPLDIIHSQHPNLLGSAARKWAQKKNIPLVFTWHTLYDRYTHFVSFVPPTLAAAWMIRGAVRYAGQSDAVIIPTESARRIISAWGLAHNHISIILTGVDENMFQQPDPARVRRHLGIPDGAPLLFSVSRLTKEKNVELLLKAVQTVLKENPQAWYLHVGEGYLRQKLEKQARLAGLERRILYVGEIPRKEMRHYYAAATIFVYASTSETQGTIFSEAMYSGLPIVAVRAAGAIDLVRDGATGLLVPEDPAALARGMMALLNNDQRRESMKKTTRQTAVQNYTASACAAKLIRVYADAIARKKAAAKIF